MSAAGPKRSTEGRTDWRTPPELFDLLNREFRFTLDGAASEANHLLPRFLSPEDDAVMADPKDETIFLNPPYGKGLVDWASMVQAWWGKGNTVVMLVPAATETGWFQRLWKVASEVRFLSPRVQFLHPDTGLPARANTGGSVVFVCRPNWWSYLEEKPGGLGGRPVRSGLWREPQAFIWNWKLWR